ncbi:MULTISPECIES: hypothetical protein [unclassified Bradyrhizobium]|uniref:hypothetical protein n=1 Tax=unclassified Bradyrhizobium TaxID=2631580 RepID=UPI001FFAE46A|nr:MULTISPECIES: hypothetical protein [unclassified Bradyrhizobium]MCK1307817.1 hypothetical protein [Bradyrhizobium sp. 45]MCK1440326.1 hypothetical protein [Bradyrhizobium sp. 15]MCK1612682.1 hypothetical protein [Bradyrhizobium sp. 163]MCK1762988.1 hypothetical protein [Bradyrhizobium sp. 136]
MSQVIPGRINTATALGNLLDLHGLKLTQEGEDALVEHLADRLVLNQALGSGHEMKYLDQDGSVADLTTYLASLYQQPETKRFFVSSGGSIRLPQGASPLTRNPFSKRSWNVTQQMLLYRDDPRYAEQLERYAATERNDHNDRGDRENPYSRAGFNLTQQMLLERNDPERAETLRRAAGVV